jgi:hypothetical protein
MDCGHVGFVSMRFSIKFCGDKVGGHSQNGHLLLVTNCIYLGVSKFHLPGVNVVDQLVAVHEVNANNVVVQSGDHIYRMCKFSSLNPEVNLVDPTGVHCVLR